MINTILLLYFKVLVTHHEAAENFVWLEIYHSNGWIVWICRIGIYFMWGDMFIDHSGQVGVTFIWWSQTVRFSWYIYRWDLFIFAPTITKSTYFPLKIGFSKYLFFTGSHPIQIYFRGRFQMKMFNFFQENQPKVIKLLGFILVNILTNFIASELVWKFFCTWKWSAYLPAFSRVPAFGWYGRALRTHDLK